MAVVYCYLLWLKNHAFTFNKNVHESTVRIRVQNLKFWTIRETGIQEKGQEYC
jgi:hypothetical protein|eukprot:jgi/Botrbrau1/16721/Bobra.0276s0001.1